MMDTTTDSQQLLAEYRVHGSETAFRLLVTRYVNFVYSMALRLVDGNSQLAEDVTQTVFINLARKGRNLASGVMLGGWLHQHTYHVATKVTRSERRRQSREREAVEMNALQENSEAGWRHLAPMLDEAITQLSSEERAAILLRFFEQRDFRAVGLALGRNEDAARMRVNRALEKLQLLLRNRGVTLSVTTLASVLTTQAVTAAPAGLAVAISGVALAGAAAAKGSALTFFQLMATTKLKLGLTSLVIAGAATSLVLQHRGQLQLREQNQTLRQEITQLQRDNANLSSSANKAPRSPRLPAPPITNTNVAATPLSLPGELSPATNYYALLTEKKLKLTAAQVEPYLNANRRDAASLLAAFRTTGDAALLEEAMQKYPDHPQVGFEAALRKEAAPEERRRWLDNFKQAAPDNALANYLSAIDYFKGGQTDQAVRELVAASGKQQFQDYSRDRVQADEEAYLAAGYPVAEAKIVASSHLLLPQLVQMRDLGKQIIDLANSYRQAGDEASGQAALQIAVSLGRRYGEPGPGEMLLGQLVGINIERMALNVMDPTAPYGTDGQTIQSRLEQLAQTKTTIRGLSKEAEPLWPLMSAQDWINYNSRSMTFGEQQALSWLVAKYGRK